jgi:hypothetical protein
MDRNQIDLLNKIRSLENNKENNISRKVRLSDLIEDNNSDNSIINKNIKDKMTKDKNMKDKIKDYRLQEEFGEKKFIKP